MGRGVSGTMLCPRAVTTENHLTSSQDNAVRGSRDRLRPYRPSVRTIDTSNSDRHRATPDSARYREFGSQSDRWPVQASERLSSSMAGHRNAVADLPVYSLRWDLIICGSGLAEYKDLKFLHRELVAEFSPLAPQMLSAVKVSNLTCQQVSISWGGHNRPASADRSAWSALLP
jgi:hypothetical protein